MDCLLVFVSLILYSSLLDNPTIILDVDLSLKMAHQRLTIMVKYGLGIHVKSSKLKIGGDIDRVGLLTMRSLDARIYLNRTKEGFWFINLTEIGVSGVNHFLQDYFIQYSSESGKLELSVLLEVEVGRTIR